MGKAIIVSHIADGLYSVTPVYESATLDRQLDTVNKQITGNDAAGAETTTQISAQQTKVTTASAALNAAITAYKADPSDENKKAVTEATVALRKEGDVLNTLNQRLGRLKLYGLRFLKSKDRLQAIKDGQTPNVNMWCADLCDGDTSDIDPNKHRPILTPGQIVGTIEIEREGEHESIIRPGYKNPTDASKANYSAGSDGLMQHIGTTTPEGAFYNTAMLPGAQKWRPKYRVGTVTGVLNDRMSVRLDTAITGWKQSIDVNQTPTLEAIKVKYMDCDGAAFDEGQSLGGDGQGNGRSGRGAGLYLIFETG